MLCAGHVWKLGGESPLHSSMEAKCVTPAMEAGISDHVWKLEEIVGLLDSN